MLRITNTLTGEKETLSLERQGEVTLYVCGVTVYDHCHLGHARSAVVFDVIRNYLEQAGLTVRYVKNYTDVDDKIIKRAEQEGGNWREIADRYIQSYEEDMVKLKVRPPTVAPRATEHIPEILQMIEALIVKGYAYALEGDVFFEVGKFPSYGMLSKQQQQEVIAGLRVEVDERKRHPSDFALWKSSRPGEPAWESPWGSGRPGWHIECSAMAMRYFGETIDFHGGGKDLVFPHHENEIAQSQAYTGKEFVRCWIHHGMVTMNDEKMSKSLGNFFTVKEIFKKSASFSFPDEVTVEVIRYYLLSTHYRSTLDFSDQSFQRAKVALDHFYTLYVRLEEASRSPDVSSLSGDPEQKIARGYADFEWAMEDDFNTPRAMGVLQTLRGEVNVLLDEGKRDLAVSTGRFFSRAGGLFGLFQVPLNRWSFHPWEGLGQEDILGGEVIDRLVREREEARRNREWAKSDEIRGRLTKAGVIIEDRPDGGTRVKR